MKCQLRFASSQHHRFLAVRRDLGENHTEAESREAAEESLCVCLWSPVPEDAAETPSINIIITESLWDPLRAGTVPSNMHPFLFLHFLLCKAEVIYSTLIL